MNTATIQWQYAVDELAIDKDLIKIRGWITHPEHSKYISSVHVEMPGDQLLSQKVQFGLPSPDVGSALGRRGENARFAVDLVFPADLSLRTFTDGVLKVSFSDGSHMQLPLRDSTHDLPTPILAGSSIRKLHVGLGITTYNRRDLIEATLDRIAQTTSLDLDIVVANDGSVDDTAAYLDTRRGISVINAPNRGIAWNKNRALYYLSAIRQCDVVLLLEDDVQPTRIGWDVEWVLAACAFGHVNFAPPWFKDHPVGTGRWHKPYRSGVVSGQCSAFTAEALAFVGYLDTRFGKYGHEHVEHTLRMIRAGYGGAQLVPDTRDSYFLLLNGGLNIRESTSSHDEASLAANTRVFNEIWNESIFRQAWRNDDEMKTLRSEMRSARRQLA